jgi:uncharacterized protein (TIGR02453 family)
VTTVARGGYHRAVGFTGFDPDMLAFYAQLRADNTKQWWTANKARYEQRVLGPVLQLAEDLHDEFGEVKIFRPYRDVRFSADKSPYKLHLGMVTVARPAHYLHVSEEGLLTGGGAYEVPTAALRRFRQLVDDDATGEPLDAVLGALDAEEFSLSEDDSLRTAPRGYSADHPRIELLRLKRLALGRSEAPADWMWSPEAGDVIRERWRTVNVWCDWLDGHLGDLLQPRQA